MLVVTGKPRSTIEQCIVDRWVKRMAEIGKHIRDVVASEADFIREIESWNELERASPVFFVAHPSWNSAERQYHIVQIEWRN